VQTEQAGRTGPLERLGAAPEMLADGSTTSLDWLGEFHAGEFARAVVAIFGPSLEACDEGRVWEH
jgi:hypothetical protein